MLNGANPGDGVFVLQRNSGSNFFKLGLRRNEVFGQDRCLLLRLFEVELRRHHVVKSFLVFALDRLHPP